MPKGRHLKIETWTDDKFVTLSPLARLLFMGMWNYACDNGHVEDNIVQLKMRVLPMDNCDIASLVEEMLNTGQVTRGDGYLKVTKLVEHQRIDLRYLTLCEWCEHDVHTAFSPSDKKGRPLSAQRAPAVSTPGAQGVHEDDGDGDGDGDGDIPSPLHGVQIDDGFEEFWDAYGLKKDRKGAEAKWKLALKKPGVTADMLIRAALEYVTYERRENENGRYIMGPAKWLLGERWTDERAGRGVGGTVTPIKAAPVRLTPDELEAARATQPDPSDLAAWYEWAKQNPGAC